MPCTAPALLPAHGPLLGLDLGARTIGVAASDRDQQLSVAVETIRIPHPTACLGRLRTIARDRATVGLVVGLPLHLDGRSGTRAQSARRVAGILGTALDLPLAFWDERWSTRAAERALIAADASRARRRRNVDAEAAVWLLQGYLDSRDRG